MNSMLRIYIKRTKALFERWSRYLIVVCIFILPTSAYSVYPWMDSTFDTIASIMSRCLTVPHYNKFNTGSVPIDVGKSNGVWVPANMHVGSGKAMSFNWNANVYYAPRKSLALYRFDARFANPQVFLLNYDYSTGKYTSDFHNTQVSGQTCSCSCAENGCVSASGASLTCPYTCSTLSSGVRTTSSTMLMPDCGGNSNMTIPGVYSSCVTAYTKYFSPFGSSGGRAGIQVNSGDVVSIGFIPRSTFISAQGSAFTKDLEANYSGGTSANIGGIYSGINMPHENRVLYANGATICNSIFPSGIAVTNEYVCNPAPVITSGSSATYYNESSFPNLLMGYLDTKLIATLSGVAPAAPTSTPGNAIPLPTSLSQASSVATTVSIYQCGAGIPATFSGSPSPLCYYAGGDGMQIAIGSNVVYTGSNKTFVNSPFNGNSYFYYDTTSSGASGTLNFQSSIPTSPMTSFAHSLMSDWGSIPVLTSTGSARAPTSITDVIDYYSSNKAPVNYALIGSYFMEVEVGLAESQNISAIDNMSNISLSYAIMPDNINAPSSGTIVQNSNQFNATDSGYVWLMVEAPIPSGGGIGGNITVNFENYTGSTILSTLMYDDLAVPLMRMISGASQALYQGLAGNYILQRIAKLMLTLYIIFYALYFLAGATQVKALDIVMRVIKISIIVVLFSPKSWDFFNGNLFQIFTQGSNQLIFTIVGATSTAGNVFSFLDIIFVKYLDPRLWGMLVIQLFQFTNGLIFFAILVIYGIYTYIWAVLEVVLAYIMAFLSLSVMISLGPIFITFCLFEKTKHLFNNWISAMLNCMLQPTILLIFFLLIDQIMTQQLYQAVAPACWGEYLPLSINLSLKPLLNWSLSFQLPFFLSIPFFIPTLDPSHIAAGVSGTYLKVIGSSIIFYCFAKVSNGLVTYVDGIVGMLTTVGSVAGAGAATSMSNSVKKGRDWVQGNIAGQAKQGAEIFKRKVIDGDFKAKEDGDKSRSGDSKDKDEHKSDDKNKDKDKADDKAKSEG